MAGGEDDHRIRADLAMELESYVRYSHKLSHIIHS